MTAGCRLPRGGVLQGARMCEPYGALTSATLQCLATDVYEGYDRPTHAAANTHRVRRLARGSAIRTSEKPTMQASSPGSLREVCKCIYVRDGRQTKMQKGGGAQTDCDSGLLPVGAPRASSKLSPVLAGRSIAALSLSSSAHRHTLIGAIVEHN